MSEKYHVAQTDSGSAKKPGEQEHHVQHHGGPGLRRSARPALDLIRKQDIDIYDIPIAKITAQFLQYVERMKKFDVDVAAEFIYTASLLIHIKSKMSARATQTRPPHRRRSARRSFNRLLEHEKYKNARRCCAKQQIEDGRLVKPRAQGIQGRRSTKPNSAADVIDLVKVFQQIMDRAKVGAHPAGRRRHRHRLADDRLHPPPPHARRASGAPEARCCAARTAETLVCAFLALLELIRLQAILVRRTRPSRDRVKKHLKFDEVLNGPDAGVRDDWR